MRAVTVTQYGATPAVAEMPTPQPGPGQVLIRLRAAGMNPMDRALASGAWKPMPATFPMVLGVDGAGVVQQLGPARGNPPEPHRAYRAERRWFVRSSFSPSGQVFMRAPSAVNASRPKMATRQVRGHHQILVIRRTGRRAAGPRRRASESSRTEGSRAVDSTRAGLVPRQKAPGLRDRRRRCQAQISRRVFDGGFSSSPADRPG
jgi:hypothetical protein